MAISPSVPPIDGGPSGDHGRWLVRPLGRLVGPLGPVGDQDRGHDGVGEGRSAVGVGLPGWGRHGRAAAGAAAVATQVDHAGGPRHGRCLPTVRRKGLGAHAPTVLSGRAVTRWLSRGQDLPGDLPVVRGQARGVAGEALLARWVVVPGSGLLGGEEVLRGHHAVGPHVAGRLAGLPDGGREDGRHAVQQVVQLPPGVPQQTPLCGTEAEQDHAEQLQVGVQALVGQGPAPTVDPPEAVDTGLVEAHGAAEEPGGGQREVEQGRRRGWGVEHHQVVALRRGDDDITGRRQGHRADVVAPTTQAVRQAVRPGAGGQHVEAVPHPRHRGERRPLDQGPVDGLAPVAQPRLLVAQVLAEVALGVEVDGQAPPAHRRRRGGQARGHRGLAHAPLAVAHDHAAIEDHPTARFPTARFPTARFPSARFTPTPFPSDDPVW